MFFFSVREDHSWKTGTLPVKGKGQRKHLCLLEQIGDATSEANSSCRKREGTFNVIPVKPIEVREHNS